ncbi:hypothetical protein AOLI_G00081910 [Acnodon oligacanthus]
MHPYWSYCYHIISVNQPVVPSFGQSSQTCRSRFWRHPGVCGSGRAQAESSPPGPEFTPDSRWAPPTASSTSCATPKVFLLFTPRRLPEHNCPQL